MNNDIDDLLSKTTFGYVEEAGSWLIDVGVPDVNSLNTINKFAKNMIQDSLESFSFVDRIVELIYDTMSIDFNGKTTKITEGVTKELGPDYAASLAQIMDPVLHSEDTCFTRVVAICDTQVLIPSGNVVETILAPRSSEFTFEYTLEFDEQERLVPVGCYIMYRTHIDSWVSRTMDPVKLHYRDNFLYAKLNQPLLEHALKKWETVLGKKISEADSRWYRDQIHEYGFKEIDSLN